jgi:Domain of unknown function (DUF4124)
MFLYSKHVESNLWLNVGCQTIGFMLVVLLLCSTSLLCHAEVYKCVGANGRIVIGDLPCVAKDAVTTNAKERVKEPSPLPAVSRVTSQPERERDILSQENLERKIQLKHDTECRDIRVHLKKHGHFASSLLLLESAQSDGDKLMWERYRIRCLPQAKDVVVLDEAQKEGAALEKARKATCDIKTRDYEKRKQTASSSLSELEVNALAVLQAEVMRGCR